MISMENCLFRIASATALMAISTTALAQSCPVDPRAVQAKIDTYEKSYRDMWTDIDCEASHNIAQNLMCDASYETDDLLWKMGRLDDLAWAYAYENATKREIDLKNPPRDRAFTARRDACRDVQCICDALVEHTNASLGGESPYARR